MNAFLHDQVLIIPIRLTVGQSVGDGWGVLRPGEPGYADWLPFTRLVPAGHKAWADALVERHPPAR